MFCMGIIVYYERNIIVKGVSAPYITYKKHMYIHDIRKIKRLKQIKQTSLGKCEILLDVSTTFTMRSLFYLF